MVHQTPRGLHTLPYNGMYFWPKIRGMKKDGPLGKIVPVIPIRVKKFIQKYQTYVWYQDDIYLADHRLVWPLQ